MKLFRKQRQRCSVVWWMCSRGFREKKTNKAGSSISEKRCHQSIAQLAVPAGRWKMSAK